MTSSRSSSSRSAGSRLTVVLLAAALGACSGGRSGARPPPVGGGGPVRVALLPVDNASAAAIPVREIEGDLEAALVRRGVGVVSGDEVDRFLARHRIRWTGGIDREAARAARAELGVDGVLVSTVELYGRGAPPSFALTMRLVGADDDATVLWFDGAARSGDDSKGLLGLGVVRDVRKVQGWVIARLTRSLGEFLAGRGPPAPRCEARGTFRPRAPFGEPLLKPGTTYTVAVLPFVNHSERRHAGDLAALGFARQLVGTDGLRVLEPGVVRELLLAFRMILNEGVSLDQTRVLLGALEADLVLTGEVYEWDDARGGGTPRVNFGVTLLDGRSGRIAWQSTSHNRGDDAVLLFDFGNVSTAHVLACRMTRNVVDEMIEHARKGG